MKSRVDRGYGHGLSASGLDPELLKKEEECVCVGGGGGAIAKHVGRILLA